MIKIWGRRNAYNVQKVLWVIGELELPYQHVNIGGSAGGLDQPDFLAMNPTGRIPVLVDEDTTIWESNSIVRYLCATYSRDHIEVTSFLKLIGILFGPLVIPFLFWAKTR